MPMTAREHGQPHSRLPAAAAARVTSIYVAVGALYIIVSDLVVWRSIGDVADFASAAVVKGLLFVLITGGILFYVVYRLVRRVDRQRASYDEILENIGDAVFVVHRPDRKIVYANGGAEEVFGYTAEELIGAPSTGLYKDEKDFHRIEKIASEQLEETGEANFRFRMRHRDGKVFPTQHKIRRYRSAEEPSKFAVSLVRDITHEVAEEERRKESEQRWRVILEAVPVPMAMVRVDNNEIAYANDALKLALGLTEAALKKGVNAADFFIDQAEFQHLRAQVLELGHIDAIEVRIRTADDAQLWVAGTSRLMSLDGQQMFLTAFIDITSLRESRELLSRTQRLEAVGQLTGGIAHDFNNLLTVILLNCESIADHEGAPDETKTYAEIAHTAGMRAADLTRKLLAFARSGTSAPLRLDLNRIVEDQYSLLRRTVGSNIEIAVVLDENPALAQIDKSGIENTIINLAVNARDAMEDGGTITISTDRVTVDASAPARVKDLPPGEYVTLSVSDTGEGMDPKTLERAFEPFFTTKAVGQGTGLGLSTVYGFATASGGTVTIESEPGDGTTVTLYLPVAHGSETAAEETEESTALPTGSEAILLVEDHRQIQEFSATQLRQLGYSVVTANDSDRAMSLLADFAQSFDLIFTDIIMPGSLDGYELVRRARALRPEIKVLVTTGYSQQYPADPKRYHLLQKPYTKATLAQFVRRAIDDPAGGD